ncbi:MAG TPA: hypothetical protein VGF87_07085 [Acidimicrobiales bacterium]|jgi:hypothetical protein
MNDIDLMPAPVPALDARWIADRRRMLTSTLEPQHRNVLRVSAALGATGVATGIATVVVSLGTTAPSAFAGWSPTPTPPAPGQVAQASVACQAVVAQAATKLAQRSTGSGAAPSAPFGAELVDSRGPFTVEVLGNGSSNVVLCASDLEATSLRFSAGPTATPAPTASSLVVDHVDYGARDGQDLTLTEGRIGSAVTTVSLTLADGTSVETTTGNGFFLAWWPGTQGITSAAVGTASGTTTQQLNLPGPDTSVSGKFLGAGEG